MGGPIIQNEMNGLDSARKSLGNDRFADKGLKIDKALALVGLPKDAALRHRKSGK